MCQPFGQSPGVHENQRRPVRIDQLDNPRIHLGPLFVHTDRPQVAGRDFDRQIQLPLVTDIQDDR